MAHSWVLLTPQRGPVLLQAVLLSWLSNFKHPSHLPLFLGSHFPLLGQPAESDLFRSISFSSILYLDIELLSQLPLPCLLYWNCFWVKLLSVAAALSALLSFDGVEVTSLSNSSVQRVYFGFLHLGNKNHHDHYLRLSGPSAQTSSSFKPLSVRDLQPDSRMRLPIYPDPLCPTAPQGRRKSNFMAIYSHFDKYISVEVKNIYWCEGLMNKTLKSKNSESPLGW